MWRELWWTMAGARVSEYEQIKRIDVFEFWKIYDLWKEKMKAERDAAKSRAERKRKKH